MKYDMSRRIVTSTLMACAVGSSYATVAKADENAHAEHLTGLEFMLRPSFGGAPSDSPVQYEPSARFQIQDPGAILQKATPYGPGFVGQAFLGYRFHPIFSAGLRGGFRTAATEAPNDGSSELSRSSWDAGFYARVYPFALTEPVRKYLDPWASVGVEYMRDVQTFKRPVGTIAADWTLDHHAVAVPLGVGVDVRVLPMLSIGPSFEYAIASGVAACADVGAPGFVGNSFCSNKDPGKQVIKANTYGVWTLGLDLKVTLF